VSAAADGDSLTAGSTEAVTLAGLPSALHWQVLPVRWSAKDGRKLTIEAGPRTDLFVDPGGSEPMLNAARLLGPIDGDFTLSAMVTVGFAGTFDAGVLMIHGGDRSWAKLCFEYSPQGQPMVVSVVTRGVSDDANSMPIDAKTVWLRVARLGSAYAFHASTDGTTWQFVRHFALDTGDAPQVGFVTQSPSGEGCTVTFEDIRFEPRRLADLRNGE
jgi:regulation of enolase protein 1 (concanavalin A-like superfamily)